MQRTSRVPDDVDLVLRPDRRAAIRGQLTWLSIFAVTAVVAGAGAVVSGRLLGVWGIIALLCLTGWLLEVLGLRSEVMFGPVLAADREHLWVRTGGLWRPASVRLDWAEVNAVALHTWHGRREASARYLTFDFTEPVRAELDGVLDSTQDRRMRRLAMTFGSPLAVAEQYKELTLDEVVRGLRALAPSAVRFTRH